LDILFIGMPSGKTKVDWTTDLSETQSLFDYDAVVVDLNHVIAPDSVIPQVGLMEDKRFEAERLLAKGGILVCLLAQETTRIFFFSIKTSSYDWIPVVGLASIVTSGEGQRILKVAKSPFDKYIDLPGTTWYAFLKESSRTRYETLAKNEADLAVAARIDLGKGSIFLLPFSKNKDWVKVLYDCLQQALSGEDQQKRPPPWVGDIRVPGEEDMVSKLKEISDKIEDLSDSRFQLSRRLENSLEIRKLLYETGTALEDTVRTSFEELGYSLKSKGDIDFVFSDDDSEIIFEVTGSVGTIEVTKIRQLLEFVLKEEKLSGRTPKGILIANAQMDLPPEKRNDPFTKAVIERATGFGICLLTTQVLFEAVMKHREGKLIAKNFWDELIQTIGTYALRESDGVKN